MKNFIKFAAVGVAGYLVGVYEMKYRVTKAMLEGFVKKEKDEKDSEEKEEEQWTDSVL